MAEYAAVPSILFSTLLLSDAKRRLTQRVSSSSDMVVSVFAIHVGVTPAALAQARRVLVAKRAIEETSRPLAEVAFASGFRSLRAFNTALAKACGKAPRDMRRARSSQLRDTAELAIVRAWISKRSESEDGPREMVH